MVLSVQPLRFSFPSSGDLCATGTVRLDQIRSAGGIMAPRLFIPIEFQLQPANGGNNPWSLLSIGAELSVADQKVTTVLPGQWAESILTVSRSITADLEFPLDARRIEWIESKRSGGLNVRCQIVLQ